MGRVIKMTQAGYPVEIKMVEGEPIEVVDIDSLTDEQFKKYCDHTGVEWFQRFTAKVQTR